MLTHVHPTPLRFADGTRPGAYDPTLIRLSVRERLRPSPPSAQSPFAHRRGYLQWGDVSHHLRGRYSSFIARTGSCARPNPSHCLWSLPRSAGLGRLPSAPAGKWPFPTLSLQSLRRCLDPYPEVSHWCTCSLLPSRRRPHPNSDGFGTPHSPGNATSTGTHISGLQSFTNVQAPTLASPPGCTHRRSPMAPGRPGRLHHASPGWLPAPGCGIATCPTRATDTAGLSPAGLQPCRLLPEFVGGARVTADEELMV